MNKYTEGQDVIFIKAQNKYLIGTVGKIVEVHKPLPESDYYYYTIFGDLYNEEHFFPEYAISGFPEEEK